MKDFTIFSRRDEKSYKIVSSRGVDYFKKSLFIFLSKNKSAIKRVTRFEGFYLIVLAGIYSCSSSSDESVSVIVEREEDFDPIVKGTESGDVIDLKGREENLIVQSLEGDDEISTGVGNDVVHSGHGKDKISTGLGDDTILIVGKTTDYDYTQEDVDDVLQSVFNEEATDFLRDKYHSEGERGEEIDGGEGIDTLIIYGEVDLTGIEIRGIENLRVHSKITATQEQLRSFSSIRGDGESELVLVSSVRTNVDLSNINLSGIRTLNIGENVEAIVSSLASLKLLEQIGKIYGKGQLIFNQSALIENGGLTQDKLKFILENISYDESFVLNDHVTIKPSGSSFSLGVDFKKGIVDEVLYVNEGENEVIGDFDFSGRIIVKNTSGKSFYINGESLYIANALNYEAEEAKKYLIVLDDGTRLSVILTDQNDAASIGLTGVSEGHSTSLGVEVDEDYVGTITGTLSISDEDYEGKESLLYVQSLVSTDYGVFSLFSENDNWVWSYDLDEKLNEVQGLNYQEMLFDEIPVESFDGTIYLLSIQINGNNIAVNQVAEFSGDLVKGGFYVGGLVEVDTAEIRDLDGLDEDVEFSYQWLRDGEEIEGEMNEEYTLTGEDLGAEISVMVSFIDSKGNDESIKALLGEIKANNIARGGIDIVGDYQRATRSFLEGSEIRAEIVYLSDGDIEENEGIIIMPGISSLNIRLNYQWLRDGEEIKGANRISYELKSEDVGKEISFLVSFVDSLGHKESLMSRGYAITNVNEEIMGEVLVSPLLEEVRVLQGSILLADTSDLIDGDGLEEARYMFQWYRDGEEIKGAISRRYLTMQADVGAEIKVKAIVEDDLGSIEEVMSSNFVLIEESNDLPMGELLLEGDLYTGETIRVETMGIIDADGLEEAEYTQVEWLIDNQVTEVDLGVTLDDGVTTLDEAEYMIKQEDLGKRIKARVTYTDDNGFENSIESVSRIIREGTSLPATITISEDSYFFLDLSGFFVSSDMASYAISALPSWLEIDRSSNIIRGFAEQEDVGVSFLAITVTDSDGVTNVEDINVTVTDENDIPQLTKHLGDIQRPINIPYAVNLDEYFFDPENSTLTYNVKSSLGWLTFDAEQGLILGTPLESHLDERGTVSITVSDDQGGEVKVSYDIEVVRNVIPRIVNKLIYVDENIEPLSRIGKITALDTENDLPNIVFSISDTERNFSINASTGNLFFVGRKRLLDAEKITSYEILVTANDSNSTYNDGVSSSNISILINDVNDNTPVINSIEIVTIVQERLNDEVIGTVLASDADVSEQNNTLTYSITGSNYINENGQEVSRYSVKDGIIMFTSPGIHIEQKTFLGVITVSDGDRAVSENIKIIVNNTNNSSSRDASNAIIGGDLEGEVVNDGISTEIGTLTVTDDNPSDEKFIPLEDSFHYGHFFLYEEGNWTYTADLGTTLDRGSTVIERITVISEDGTTAVIAITLTSNTYGIHESFFINEGSIGSLGEVLRTDPKEDIAYNLSDENNFSVNQVTGELFLINSIDYEERQSLNLIITIDNGAGIVSSSAVNVSIQDLNDNPPVLVDIINQTYINSGIPSIVGTVFAIDPDTVGDLSYRVNDSRFSIDNQGILRSLSGQVFYSDTVNQTLSIEIQVSDGINNSSSNFDIFVEGYIKPRTKFYILEGTVGIVGDVVVNFADEDSTYSLESGSDFSITEEGILSLDSAKSFNNSSESPLFVDVTVTDALGEEETVTVEVVILDNARSGSRTRIAGLSINPSDMSSWHDAAYTDSVRRTTSAVAADGDTVQRWNDRSSKGNFLAQNDASFRPTYQDGVISYEINGRTYMDYNRDAVGTSGKGITTFSVLKVKGLKSNGNFLFGDDDKWAYHGGSNGKIFGNIDTIGQIRIDGVSRTTSNAEWGDEVDGNFTPRTQIIYTRSKRTAEAVISTLSKDRNNDDRSLRADISEVIVFTKELNDVESVLIHNYLSSKWDILLESSMDYYDGDTEENNNYDYDVTGLLKLSSGEILQTADFGGIKLSNHAIEGAIQDEGDAFFVGNDGARQWYGDFTDAPGTTGGKIDMYFSASYLNLTAGLTYSLSVGSNNYYSQVEGDYVKFEGVEAQDSTYYLNEVSNRANIIDSQSFEFIENFLGTLGVVAIDNPSNLRVIYSLPQNDTFVINKISGILSLLNSPSLATNELLVTLDDGINRTSSVVSIVLNEKPVIQSIDMLVEYVEETVSSEIIGSINASDPSDEPISYSISGDGFSIDNVGFITFSPSSEIDGLSKVFRGVITVSDTVQSVTQPISIRVNNTDGSIPKALAGLDLGTSLFSWHDASIANSFVDSMGNPVSDGSSVFEWLDQSSNVNNLTQTEAINQGVYEEGVLRYSLTGSSYYSYNTALEANNLRQITTFSVVNVKELSGFNFLFGDDSGKYGYHGDLGSNIFIPGNSSIEDIKIDGDTQSELTAEWEEGRTQLIYTLSDNSTNARIANLSQEDGKSLKGDISEVILINKKLSNAEVVLINNYLSSKWGTDLVGTSDYYEGDSESNGDYDNEVSGILKLSDSNVLETAFYGGVSITNSATEAVKDNGDAFLMGHNGELGISRKWYGDFTDARNNGGAVNLIFHLISLDLTGEVPYELLVGSKTYSAIASSSELIFQNIIAEDGVYFLRAVDLAPSIEEISEPVMSLGEDAGITIIGTVSALENDGTGEELSYMISGEGFTVDADGVIRFTPPNIHLPTRIYTAKVTVSDGVNEVTEDITIEVSNTDSSVNEVPMINVQAFTIAENETGELGRITGSDGNGDGLVYSLPSGTPFSITPEGDLSLVIAQDYESNDSVLVTVTVSDGYGEETAIMTVNITNLNDSSPEIVLTNYSASLTIEENAGITVIGTASANDGDGGINSLTYSISGRGFTIADRVISFDPPEKNIGEATDYEGELTVSDGTYQSTQLIYVSVSNTDGSPFIHPRIILPSSALGTDINIDENSTGILSTIQATDETPALLTFSIEGGMPFTITDEGVLSLADAQDYETNQSLSVIVTVRDNQSLSSTAEIIVNINNLNDNAPEIVSILNPVSSIEENAGESVIGTLTARDSDENSLVFSIAGEGFAIDSDGVISFMPEDIHESSINYTGTITVSDGVNEETQSIAIMVNNTDGSEINLEPIIADSLSFNIAENITGVVGQVGATDANGDSITFSTDSEIFGITPDGQLSLRIAQDYESNTSLSVVVTASDGSLSSSKSVTVDIDDVAFGIKQETLNIDENSTGKVFSLDAFEEFSGADVSFSVTSSYFSVTSGGILTLIDEVNYEQRASLSITVTATDGLLTVSKSITIDVKDDASDASDSSDRPVVVGIRTGNLYSWLDATQNVRTLSDPSNQGSSQLPAENGDKVRIWKSVIGSKSLYQNSSNNNLKPTFIDDGTNLPVIRFNNNGQTYLQFTSNPAHALKATSSRPLVTFSVVKVVDIPSHDANFLFGSGDKFRYHGSKAGRIFSGNAWMNEVRVDGQHFATTAAEWGTVAGGTFTSHGTQIIYTRSRTSDQVKIQNLSKDRGHSNRGIRGDVSEVLIFTNTISPAERLVIQNYLASKWGIDLAVDDYYDGDTDANGNYDFLVGGLIKTSASEILSTSPFEGVSMINSADEGAIADDGDSFLLGRKADGPRNVDTNALEFYGDFRDNIGGRLGGTIDFKFSKSVLSLEDGLYSLSINGQNYLLYTDSDDVNLTFKGVTAQTGEYSLVKVSYQPIATLTVVENQVGSLGSIFNDVSPSSIIYKVEAGNFFMEGSELFLNTSQDFETVESLSVSITVSDGDTTETVIPIVVRILNQEGTTFTGVRNSSDSFTGTREDDDFIFGTLDDTVEPIQDIISSFSSSDGDKIDLSGLGLSGSIDFGTDDITDFTSMLTTSVYVYDRGGGTQIIYVNGDSDFDPDLEILVTSDTVLTIDDFIM